ncbi:MAG: TIGR00730 family Rossman fold protein [candidate division Zixibacteria bacterium]|nr:TIGR00730 family Rossman fold protein [candidate division Zixibacteria bacterium]
MSKNNQTKLIKNLMRSPAYRLAFHDNEFMSEDFNRPVRLQLELLKTDMRLREEKIVSTIVTFGGTRILEPVKARAKVRRIEQRLKKSPKDESLKQLLTRAKKVEVKSRFYDEAREFARLVSSESQNHQSREFVMVTGGGPGIMEASNRGAHDVGAKSIGLNITLPEEQEPNAYISEELCFQFHYFALRKMHFLLRAKALVAFPGGFGTLDELFEALTLLQTRKIIDLPIILFGETYWKKVINFNYLVEEGTIDEKDLKLFVFADKAADAWNYIKTYYQSRGEI